MDISLDNYGFLLPTAIIIVVIAAIIVVVFIQQSNKGPSRNQGNDSSLFSPHHRPGHEPDAKPEPAISSSANPVSSAGVADTVDPKDIDLIHTRKDLTESFVALSEKYSLASFTITTADGLIIASSGGDTAQTDAAMYSEIYKNERFFETPGVELFDLTHKGSELIGIIRAKNTIAEDIRGLIVNDTKAILNWWI